MRVYLLGALSIWLASGATAGTALNEPAAQTFHSTESATKVVLCLQGTNSINAALETEDGSKVIVVRNGYGSLLMTFAVYPDGSGSRIEYRPKMPKVGEAWRQCIAAEARQS